MLILLCSVFSFSANRTYQNLTCRFRLLKKEYTKWAQKIIREIRTTIVHIS